MCGCVSFLVVAGDSSQNKNNNNHTFISYAQFLQKILLGFFILEKQFTSQCVFLVRSKHSITLYLSLAFHISTESQS
jgi:hypothetical protein